MESCDESSIVGGPPLLQLSSVFRPRVARRVLVLLTSRRGSSIRKRYTAAHRLYAAPHRATRQLARAGRNITLIFGPSARTRITPGSWVVWRCGSCRTPGNRRPVPQSKVLTLPVSVVLPADIRSQRHTAFNSFTSDAPRARSLARNSITFHRGSASIIRCRMIRSRRNLCPTWTEAPSM